MTTGDQMMIDAEAMDLRAGAHADSALVLAPASLVRAMLMIAILELLLALSGFARTWRWIRAWSRRAPILDVDDASVARVEYGIALAAALYPGRAACLERSLALYWYLRRRRVDVRYRMGVQAYPFAAHAWVEYGGRPINDIPEHVRRFRPLEGLDS